MTQKLFARLVVRLHDLEPCPKVVGWSIMNDNADCKNVAKAFFSLSPGVSPGVLVIIIVTW